MGKQIETYPPKKWVCPECGKTHKGPHWAHDGQLDYNVKPSVPGRVLFNRRHKDDSLDRSMKILDGLPKTGPKVDDEDIPNPIYCPHCGWEDTVIVLKRGELDDAVDTFLNKVGVDPTKTIGEILRAFSEFLKEART